MVHWSDVSGWSQRGIAISGTGWAARQHVPALQTLGPPIRVIRSGSRERAKVFAEDNGIADWTFSETWSDVAKAAPVAVVMADNGRNRADDIEEVSSFGIPIIAEKPIALTWMDCLRAVSAVKSAAVPSAVALVARLATVVQQMRMNLALTGSGSPRWGGFNYQGSVTPDRLKEKAWMASSRTSGGLIPLLGIHGLDLLLFLGYGPGAPPGLMSAHATSVPHETADLAQYIAGTFVLEDGFVGSVETALSSPGGPFFDIRLQSDAVTLLGGQLFGDRVPEDIKGAKTIWGLDHRDTLYRRLWERIIGGDPEGDLLTIPGSLLLHQLCYALERGGTP